MKRACIAGIIGGIFLGMLIFYGAEYHLFRPPHVQGLIIQQADRLQLDKKRNFPGAIIIGVKKGGTRALLSMLKVHPDVASAGGEVHFFDRNATYGRGLEWYRNRMPTTDKKLTIEKTPAYFVIRDVPARVFKFSQTVKLILIVRDPVERAISDYTQLNVKKKARRLETPSFEKVAFDISGNVRKSASIIRVSLYDVHFKRWLDYFKRDQIHIVNGDMLIKHPAPELRKVERFLQLKPYYTDSMFVYNRTKGFYCWKKPTIKSKWSRAPPDPKSSPNLITVCLGAAKGRKHPKVAPEAIKKLKAFFRPHMKRFYVLAGQTFNWTDL